MERGAEKTARVLILFYSLSAQTSGLIHHFAAGLSEQGAEVVLERLQPVNPIRFPLGTVPATLVMMLTTFFRRRVPIEPLSASCWEPYDLLVLAGPTWSYHPSGPVLSLFARDGAKLFRCRQVLPMISCRGYWRMHWFGLRRLLRRCQAAIPNKIIFTHPSKEPWRTVGVFLKLAGRVPGRAPLIGRYYPRYGHSRSQMDEAQAFGRQVGAALLSGASLAALDLTPRVDQPTVDSE